MRTLVQPEGWLHYILKKLHNQFMALAHAILALIADCPSSGYDLVKRFEGSVGFFWKATHQQVYRELAKLEDQGWIESEVIPQVGRPDKKLHRMTPTGQAQLIQWMQQPCEVAPVKDDLLVKLFAGALVHPSLLQQELERHRQSHQQILQTYEAIASASFPDPMNLSLDQKCQYLTLRRGIRHEQDWLAWCDEAIALLQSTPEWSEPESKIMESPPGQS